MLRKKLVSVVVSTGDQGANFSVNQLGSFFRVRFLQHRLARLRHVETNVADFFIHAVMDYLSVCTLGHFPQIILSCNQSFIDLNMVINLSTDC